MRKFLIFTALLLNLARESHSTEVLKVVATVDDHAITSRYIEDKIALYEIFLSGQKINQESLYKLALQNSIDDCIISNYYKNYTIPDFAITELINKLLLDNNMKFNDLETFLISKGLTIKNLKDYFYNQMIWSNFLLEDLYTNSAQRDLFERDFAQSKAAQQKIVQNDQEASRLIVEKHFNNQSKVLLSEIIIKSNNQKAIKKILEGANFTQIKKEFPADVELQGGDGALDWIAFSELSEPYQEAVKSTSLGKISQPIIAEGFMIFLKILALEGFTEKKYQQNPNYLNLPKEKKIAFELQKTLGEHYSSYKLKSLRAKHYIQIFES